MNLWSSKERVYSDDVKLTAIVVGGLIVMVAITFFSWITVTCIETKGCV